MTFRGTLSRLTIWSKILSINRALTQVHRRADSPRALFRATSPVLTRSKLKGKSQTKLKCLIIQKWLFLSILESSTGPQRLASSSISKMMKTSTHRFREKGQSKVWLSMILGTMPRNFWSMRSIWIGTFSQRRPKSTVKKVTIKTGKISTWVRWSRSCLRHRLLGSCILKLKIMLFWMGKW